MKVEKTIEIDRPAKEIFDFIANVENHKKFGTAFHETRQVSEGPLAVGSQILRKGKFMGKELETHQEVSTFIPNKQISFKTIKGAIEAEDSFILEEKDGKTQFTLTIEAQPTGMMKLAAGMIKSKIAEQVSHDLEVLKSIMEN